MCAIFLNDGSFAAIRRVENPGRRISRRKEGHSRSFENCYGCFIWELFSKFSVVKNTLEKCESPFETFSRTV